MSELGVRSILAAINSSSPEFVIHGTHSQLVAWIFLNMWPSHFGLPIILATVLFSKRVHRHPTFASMCIIWIIIGLSSSILVYAGETTGPEPSKILCLFQSSLLYSMPAMGSLSAFTLVLQMFLTVRESVRGEEKSDEDHRLRLWAMLSAPYLALIVSTLATAIAGAANPDSISRHRRFFYCSVQNSPLTNTITTFAAFVLAGTVVFEVWTVVILYKRWALSRGLGLKWMIDFNLHVRVMTFGIYVVIGLSLNLLSIHAPESPAPDLIIATTASAVVVIFGTQRDIVDAWCFWRHNRPQPAAVTKLSKGEYIDVLA